MASSDVRDVFDLPAGDAPPRPAKKQKIVEKRPEGVSRELFSLLGERAAPVSITEHIKYKERPKWNQKVSHWEMKGFTNPAREDGLVLRHWQRKGASAAPDPNAMTDGEPESRTTEADSATALEYHFAKFNVKVDVPSYTDEEYAKIPHSEAWSKEETDYLFNLCRDYDLRWVVINDRYNFAPSAVKVEQSHPVVSPSRPSPSSRTLEQLKARFYSVSAFLMTLKRPLEHMTPQEYNQYEVLSKFDAVSETRRKTIANNLSNRSAAEVEEEGILLAELRRILNDRPRMAQDRADIYSTLQSAPSNQASAVASLYQSSTGLSQLMAQLLQADKHKKRRSLLGPNGEPLHPSAATPTSAHPTSQPHRESLSGPSATTPTTATLKKTTAASTAASNQPRPLPAATAARYGVTYHDRLAPGTSLRHERVIKLSTGKSNVQTLRLTAALTELSVPQRLVMPTAPVCDVFEQLVHAINGLLDVRKQRERVDGEIKVLEASRAPPTTSDDPTQPEPESQNDNLASDAAEKMDVDPPATEAEPSTSTPAPVSAGAENPESATPHPAAADSDPKEPAAAAGSGAEEADDAKTSAAVTPAASDEPDKKHKRSASVLSQASQASHATGPKRRKGA